MWRVEVSLQRPVTKRPGSGLWSSVKLLADRLSCCGQMGGVGLNTDLLYLFLSSFPVFSTFLSTKMEKSLRIIESYIIITR